MILQDTERGTLVTLRDYVLESIKKFKLNAFQSLIYPTFHWIILLSVVHSRHPPIFVARQFIDIDHKYSNFIIEYGCISHSHRAFLC